MEEPVHFKVIIPSYNSLEWLKINLNSVRKQSYKNFAVCVIDDASTQEGQKEFILSYCKENNWKYIIRENNHGGMRNIIDAIQLLKPQDDDVIITIDGDDWLYHSDVFAILAEKYKNKDLLVTFGQYIEYPRWFLGSCAAIPNETLQKGNFREIHFIFSHLRTFRHKIWKLIEDSDLRDEQGNYFKTAQDRAMMYPIVEMCGGEGCQFIQDVLYVYNNDNPINDAKVHRKNQLEMAAYIKAKPSYQRVFFNKVAQERTSLKKKMQNKWICFYRKWITPRTYQVALKKIGKVLRFILHRSSSIPQG